MSIYTKKADMYRLVQDCAEQMPFPVPLPKIRRTHFGTTIAKNVVERRDHTVFCLPHGDFGRDGLADGSL